MGGLFFSEEGAKALARLTALTHLDLGDDDGNLEKNPPDFYVSIEGARALVSHVCL
jgi:hypothetical protein